MPMFRHALSLAAIAVPIALFVGCSSNKSGSPPGQRLRGDTTERHFQLALQNLKRLDEFDDQILSNQVVNNLNRWIADQPEDDNWQADELLELLPQSYRDAAVPTHGRLDEMSFGYDDFYYLRQNIWARNVANWVSQQSGSVGFEWLIGRIKAAATENDKKQIDEAGDKLLAAVRVAHPDLSASDAGQLVAALRLFDWTVRNVQLNSLEQFEPVSTTRRTIQRPNGTEQVEFRWSFPAQDGKVGPGYTMQPWESMLYGQGDAWQRARVFIQLARQLDITAVMLAFDETEPANWWRPWAPAVYLGGELYLMDSALGLPLPAFEGPGIATLSELVSAPAAVRALDVPAAGSAESEADSNEAGERLLRYPVDDEDLRSVAVLIDASFAALSRRMVYLERKLVGEDRLVLTLRPSEFVEELRACKGVKDVRLWTIPFDALMYSHAVKEGLTISEESRLFGVRRTRMYGEVNDLAQGRHLHFQGRLLADRESRQSGALDYYEQANRSDEQIWRLVNYNEQALAELANRSRRASGDDAEAPAFSTIDDPATRRAPEAKWLSLEGLRQTLAENDIEVTEAQLKQLLATELLLKSTHARYWMALALYELRSLPNSADWLRRLQTLYEGAEQFSTGTNYNLARAYEAMGDTERATKLYQSDTSPQRPGSIVRSRLLNPGSSPVPGQDD